MKKRAAYISAAMIGLLSNPRPNMASLAEDSSRAAAMILNRLGVLRETYNGS